MAAFAQVLSHTGILKAIQEQVRFARARFGTYEPFRFCCRADRLYARGANPPGFPFMNSSPHLPSRSWPCLAEISCLIARPYLVFPDVLDQETVEVLRTLFQEDLLARKPFPTPFGLFDRQEVQLLVIDVDGTRATARQRALPLP